MVNGVWRLNQPNIKNINDIVLPSLCVKKMKGKISHVSVNFSHCIVLHLYFEMY